MLVTSIAKRNSLKSIEPFLSVSNVLKHHLKREGAEQNVCEPPEHMITEFCSVARGEALGVDLHESIRRELAVRAILFEPLVPFIDGALVVPRV